MRLLKSLYYRLLDILRLSKEKGIWAGLTQLAQTIVYIFFSQEEFVVLAKIISANEVIIAPAAGLVIQQIKNREELTLMNSAADMADAARFRQMFDTGSIVFNAFQDGQLAGWGWISEKIDLQTNRVQAPLEPGDACLHDLFVLPDYRNQNIARRLVACRFQYLQKHRYKRSIITCSKNNVPALKVAQNSGYVQIGESRHTRFLFWDHLKYTPYELMGEV